MKIDDVKFILLISSFVVPFILAIVLLSQSKKDKVKLFVVAGLLDASAIFFFNYIYFQHYFQLYYYCNALHLATILWIFPIIYHIFKLLIDGKISVKQVVIHFIPGMLIALSAAVLLNGLTPPEVGIRYFENYCSGIEFESQILQVISTVRLVNVVLLVLQISYYLIKISGLTQLIRKKHTYQTQDGNFRKKNWINWFSAAFTTIAILCILYYVYVPHEKHEDFFLVLFLFILACIILYVSIMSLAHNTPDYNLTVITEIADTEEVERSKEELFLETITQKISAEQLYLKPDLTLIELSRHLNTNRTYLSTVINHQTGMNFNAFINDFRLKHIALYAKKNPKVCAEKLAEVGGFGSVSSMRRAMKRQEELNQDNTGQM